MTEDLLHFQWQYNHAQLNKLTCSTGELVEIIDPGEHNYNSGPDFFNAKVKIGGTIWAGNVEIHVKSSDWKKHKHQHNSQYNSVILQIVAQNDCVTYNSKNEIIPTLEIPYPNELEWKLQRLVASGKWIPCADVIGNFPPVSLNLWLSSLCVERMEDKTQDILADMRENNFSWEEAFYHSVARSFGLKINALPFELVSKSTPLKYLSKIKNNLTQLEAMLFGQAGLLDNTSFCDDYINALKNEYRYLKQKHQLNSIPSHLWKFMRLRPVAFPTIRLAQFAKLIHQSSGLFSKAIEAKNLKEFENLFTVTTSEYWETHYTFDKNSKKCSKRLGPDTVTVIVINSVVPFLFAYGKSRNNHTLTDRAISILEELKSEKNSIVKGFTNAGLKIDNAFMSQSLVQLKTKYCDSRKCLFCHVGTNILLKKE